MTNSIVGASFGRYENTAPKIESVIESAAGGGLLGLMPAIKPAPWKI
jgi:hypothetical protein